MSLEPKPRSSWMRGRISVWVAVLSSAAVACSLERDSSNEMGEVLAGVEVVRELVFIVRVEGKGEDVRLEIPLPLGGDNVKIFEEELRLRGFSFEERVEDGIRTAILEYPVLEGRRRFTYKAVIGLQSMEHEVISPEPKAIVNRDLRVYTLPTPRMQSRSPLVRERLIEHVEPGLEAGDEDIVRMIFGLVAGRFERRTSDGTGNVLRALREEQASDRGLDRLLITFMRAAGIPARPVAGFHLRTEGGRKFERWTEIHVGEGWVPMSAPKGWYGVQPPDYLRLYHGERRFIEREGVERLTFKVLVSEPNEEESGKQHLFKAEEEVQ